MSALSEQLCFDAHQVASSTLFKLLLLVKMLISFAGALSVVLLFRRKGCGWIPNSNASVLYKTHIYLSFHTAFFFTVVYIIELIRTSLPSDDPCYYLLDARLSCVLRFLPVLALITQSFNMFTFALERLVSTLCPRQYEAVSSSYFGLFLVAVSVTAGFVLPLLTLYLPIKPNSYVTAITVVNPQNRSTFQIAVGFPLLLEVITITVFGLTYCLNQYKSRLLEQNSSKLSDRYQLAENKKVIGTLFPCFIVHFFLNSFTYGGLTVYPMFFARSDPVASTLWIEAFAHAQHYAILMPGILFWKTRRSHRVSIYDADQATVAHFKKLNELFGTP